MNYSIHGVVLPKKRQRFSTIGMFLLALDVQTYYHGTDYRFCKPSDLDMEDGDGDGGPGKLSSGTGLGEGEGQKDVSDRIENQVKPINDLVLTSNLHWLRMVSRLDLF